MSESTKKVKKNCYKFPVIPARIW